ncbi:hypothetical protein H0H92_011027, partial [Tricholoma furcatifolium]
SSDEEQQPDPAPELGSDLEEDNQDPAEVQFAGTAGVADPCSFKVAMNSAQKDCELLERFSMDTANPVKVPIAPGTKLSKKMAPQTEADMDRP